MADKVCLAGATLVVGALMAKIEKISLQNPEPEKISRAAGSILAGRLVIYPTETCYGLGTNALSEKAVRAVYGAKRRQKSPIPIIVADLMMAERFCLLTEEERKIVDRLMPGPLTLVAKKKAMPGGLPNILTKGGTIAFRVSSCPVAAALTRAADVPITATSANISVEEPSRYSIEEISPNLKEAVDLILDAGPLPKISPSTVAQIVNKKVKILRQGPVSKKKIEQVLK